MTFFYDLNKRMAELSQKQTLAEHSVPAVQPTKKSPMTQALNERDMGKHNNATTGFAALAKKAGKEYGSKAAGERVAGAQFQKMKKSGKIEEEGDTSRLTTTTGGRANMPTSDVRSKYYPPAKPPVKKFAQPTTAFDRSKTGGLSTAYAPDQASRPAGMNPDPASRYAMGEEGGIPMTAKQKSFAALAPPKDKITFADKIAGAKQEVEEMLGDVAAEAIKSALTPKQKSFAKLAPPADKITYADKIAGARKGNKQVADEGAGQFYVYHKTKGDRAGGASYDLLKTFPDKDSAMAFAQTYNNKTPADKKNFHSAVVRTKSVKQETDEGALSRNDNDPVRAKLAKAIGKYFNKIYSYDDSGLDIMDSMCPTFNRLMPKYSNDLDKMGQKAPAAVLKRIAQELKACAEECDLSLEEGWDDMVGDVKKRMGPKVGDVKRGARHDIETTATGIKATRRHDDETDDQPTGEKRRAGRPKGADKGPERVTSKAYKHKGGRVKEDGMEDMIEPHDSGEYDHEGEMAKDSIKTVVRHAQALEKILGDNDNLPEWVQSKLAKIESMMTAVDDYMQNQQDDEQPLDEKEKTEESGLHWLRGDHKNPEKAGKKVTKDIEYDEKKKDGIQSFAQRLRSEDDRAERAGKKVTKDIEYDEKKKDHIHGKKRGSEDDRAEKAGKRVTKDIEYDEKKKEKKVDETTTSGSVATGGDAPKAGKGGMQVGKGIYDSLNRKLENMIAESMSINVSMTNDDNGSHKNITVTAADEDAEMLAQLLRSAGLGGGAAHDHGHEEPCPDCGSTDCGCDEGVAEAYGDTTATQNEPNWPTDTETSDDAMQYSGGLNGPKSTGQTTVPVIAHQGARTGVDDEELRRMMEMAGIKQQELKPWERTMKESGGMDDDYNDDIDPYYQGYAGEEPDAEIVTTPQGNEFKWHYADGETDATFVYPGGEITVAYDNTARAFDTDNMQTDDKVARHVFSSYGKNLPKDEVEIGKLIDKIIDMKKRGMTEGVVDKVKDVVKKGIDALKGPDDDKLLSKLEKETGGKRPEKKDEKMQESLMQEFANFKI